jgi:hypothetical protein
MCSFSSAVRNPALSGESGNVHGSVRALFNYAHNQH